MKPAASKQLVRSAHAESKAKLLHVVGSTSSASPQLFALPSKPSELLDKAPGGEDEDDGVDNDKHKRSSSALLFPAAKDEAELQASCETVRSLKVHLTEMTLKKLAFDHASFLGVYQVVVALADYRNKTQTSGAANDLLLQEAAEDLSHCFSRKNVEESLLQPSAAGAEALPDFQPIIFLLGWMMQEQVRVVSQMPAEGGAPSSVDHPPAKSEDVLAEEVEECEPPTKLQKVKTSATRGKIRKLWLAEDDSFGFEHVGMEDAEERSRSEEPVQAQRSGQSAATTSTTPTLAMVAAESLTLILEYILAFPSRTGRGLPSSTLRWFAYAKEATWMLVSGLVLPDVRNKNGGNLHLRTASQRFDQDTLTGLWATLLKCGSTTCATATTERENLRYFVSKWLQTANRLGELPLKPSEVNAGYRFLLNQLAAWERTTLKVKAVPLLLQEAKAGYLMPKMKLAVAAAGGGEEAEAGRVPAGGHQPSMRCLGGGFFPIFAKHHPELFRETLDAILFFVGGCHDYQVRQDIFTAASSFCWGKSAYTSEDHQRLEFRKKTRAIVLRHCCDKVSYVRGRCLKLLGDMIICASESASSSQNSVEDLQFFADVAEEAARRLRDQSSNIRRQALKLCSLLIEHEPFTSRLASRQLHLRRNSRIESAPLNQEDDLLGEDVEADTKSVSKAPSKSCPLLPASGRGLQQTVQKSNANKDASTTSSLVENLQARFLQLMQTEMLRCMDFLLGSAVSQDVLEVITTISKLAVLEKESSKRKCGGEQVERETTTTPELRLLRQLSMKVYCLVLSSSSRPEIADAAGKSFSDFVSAYPEEAEHLFRSAKTQTEQLALSEQMKRLAGAKRKLVDKFTRNTFAVGAPSTKVEERDDEDHAGDGSLYPSALQIVLAGIGPQDVVLHALTTKSQARKLFPKRGGGAFLYTYAACCRAALAAVVRTMKAAVAVVAEEMKREVDEVGDVEKRGNPFPCANDLLAEKQTGKSSKKKGMSSKKRRAVPLEGVSIKLAARVSKKHKALADFVAARKSVGLLWGVLESTLLPRFSKSRSISVPPSGHRLDGGGNVFRLAQELVELSFDFTGKARAVVVAGGQLEAKIQQQQQMQHASRAVQDEPGCGAGGGAGFLSCASPSRRTRSGPTGVVRYTFGPITRVRKLVDAVELPAEFRASSKKRDKDHDLDVSRSARPLKRRRKNEYEDKEVDELEDEEQEQQLHLVLEALPPPPSASVRNMTSIAEVVAATDASRVIDLWTTWLSSEQVRVMNTSAKEDPRSGPLVCFVVGHIAVKAKATLDHMVEGSDHFEESLKDTTYGAMKKNDLQALRKLISASGLVANMLPCLEEFLVGSTWSREGAKVLRRSALLALLKIFLVCDELARPHLYRIVTYVVGTCFHSSAVGAGAGGGGGKRTPEMDALMRTFTPADMALVKARTTASRSRCLGDCSLFASSTAPAVVAADAKTEEGRGPQQALSLQEPPPQPQSRLLDLDLALGETVCAGLADLVLKYATITQPVCDVFLEVMGVVVGKLSALDGGSSCGDDLRRTLSVLLALLKQLMMKDFVKPQPALLSAILGVFTPEAKEILTTLASLSDKARKLHAAFPEVLTRLEYVEVVCEDVDVAASLQEHFCKNAEVFAANTDEHELDGEAEHETRTPSRAERSGDNAIKQPGSVAKVHFLSSLILQMKLDKRQGLVGNLLQRASGLEVVAGPGAGGVNWSEAGKLIHICHALAKLVDEKTVPLFFEKFVVKNALGHVLGGSQVKEAAGVLQTAFEKLRRSSAMKSCKIGDPAGPAKSCTYDRKDQVGVILRKIGCMLADEKFELEAALDS
eukprot:CAMPEP_0179000972 /NCGR_PEP_ID=MMETSP0795-20121207/11033_1 /TAXON_ID=88552 /ORGANISM="Amoebophrya sp., Strain Ameob2" /LENGTH=1822 /DNA_ID=CAMNT_0020694157 /DNA_START=208 /DNA_END=5676 /DNA_ORIENTATION=-